MKCINGNINQIDWILIAASPLTKLKMNPHAQNVLCVEGGQWTYPSQDKVQKRRAYIILKVSKNCFSPSLQILIQFILKYISDDRRKGRKETFKFWNLKIALYNIHNWQFWSYSNIICNGFTESYFNFVKFMSVKLMYGICRILSKYILSVPATHWSMWLY